MTNFMTAECTDCGVGGKRGEFFTRPHTHCPKSISILLARKATGARIYFKGFYPEELITSRAHLDISELERTYLPIQEMSKSSNLSRICDQAGELSPLRQPGSPDKTATESFAPTRLGS